MYRVVDSIEGSAPAVDPPSRLSPALSFLSRYGFTEETLHKVDTRARAFGVEPLDVLLLHGHLHERDYFRALAIDLGLEFEEPEVNEAEPFFDVPKADVVALQTHLIHARDAGRSDRAAFIAPDEGQIIALRGLVQQRPEAMRKAVSITTRERARDHMRNRAAPTLLRQAIHGLRERLPDLSAHRTITPRQAVFLLVLLQVLIVAAFFTPGLVPLLLHLTASMFYLTCVFLRFLALADFKADRRTVPPPGEAKVDRGQDHLLPEYSVLIALYDEANQVFALLDALTRLDWPREKLEIVLVCEADDHDTLNAARKAAAAWPDGLIRVEAVPSAQPRTKPKALNFALPLCTGEFIVIYDAEDRPDPLQLREAFTRFHADESGSLVCLQAPLVIHNHDEGFLPRLFSIEYSSLFDGLLPYLARKRLPLPLGGTSNHFRTDILRAAGGWDPYNVTEDADLGLRLARHGYSIGTLRHPTLEEAPTAFMAWLRQRTRWFKGWFQTWLVNMRHPIRQTRELGWRGTIAFHVLVTGMVVSALVHPILLWFIVEKTIGFASSGWTLMVADPLFLFDLTTVLLGYIAVGALAWKTLPVRGLRHLRTAVWALPFYWMAISLAAWRALLHVIWKPHEWEKTPHTHRPVHPPGAAPPSQSPTPISAKQ